MSWLSAAFNLIESKISKSFLFFKSSNFPIPIINSTHFSISKISLTDKKLLSFSKDNSCKLRQSWIEVSNIILIDSGLLFKLIKISIYLFTFPFSFSLILILYLFKISLHFLISLISFPCKCLIILLISSWKLVFLAFIILKNVFIDWAISYIYSFLEIKNRSSYIPCRFGLSLISKISNKFSISLNKLFGFPINDLMQMSNKFLFIFSIPFSLKSFLNSLKLFSASSKHFSSSFLILLLASL